MKRIIALALFLALPVASPAASPAATTPEPQALAPEAVVGMTRLPVRIGGRVEALGSGGFIHDWPAVYVEGRFSGDRLAVLFDDPGSRWQVSFDEAPPRVIDRPGTRAFVFTGLGRGHHSVRMEKVSESSGAVLGVFVPTAANALPVPSGRHRQIEFIGDSDLVGLGVHSHGRECSENEVHVTTDTQVSFGPRVARALDADYEVIARSGIGVVRNYGGARPEEQMPEAYRRADPPAPDWHPSVIVVALGSNDFADGGGDAGPLALWPSYEEGVAAFATELLADHPKATLVFVTGAEDNAWTEATRQGLARLDPAHAHRIGLVEFPQRALMSCLYHPTMADQELMARPIIDWLAARPEVWRQP